MCPKQDMDPWLNGRALASEARREGSIPSGSTMKPPREVDSPRVHPGREAGFIEFFRVPIAGIAQWKGSGL